MTNIQLEDSSKEALKKISEATNKIDELRSDQRALSSEWASTINEIDSVESWVNANKTADVDLIPAKQKLEELYSNRSTIELQQNEIRQEITKQEAIKSENQLIIDSNKTTEKISGNLAAGFEEMNKSAKKTLNDKNESTEAGNLPETIGTDNSKKQPKLIQTYSKMFKVPNWSYDNFIKETNNFRKGILITDEPGWFYFKIFFHFDDKYGLLGDIIKRDKDETNNTAFNYLYKRTREVCGFEQYTYDKLDDRLNALERFVKMLSFINTETPWFFDKIDGLAEISPDFKELTKERSISVSCMKDAIDMRLTTLFHLYQYACFDEINQKEIIPENLRKFNMSIVIFHVPLRHYGSAFKSGGGNFSSKALNGEFENRMSYKMFTLRGCEFDLSTLNSTINTLDNSTAFNLGENSFKIKYNRAYSHLMNEWEKFMIGPDGFSYNDKNAQLSTRLTEILDNIKNPTAQQIYDIEEVIGQSFFKTTSESLGNVYNTKIYDFKEDALIWSTTPGLSMGNIYLVPANFKSEYDKSPYDLIKRANYYSNTGDYKKSLQNVVQSWKKAGKNLKFAWEDFKTNAESTLNTLTGTFKF